ncbi:ankyrin repeat domain-containing protein [Candidatus Kuenenia sp.]|uniref:ankyrin repeat domain-containing protein n=1 Tax=Candidatus Kuenenia sp. TaxID=2499824 RepID=UPI0032203E2D
MGIFSGFQNKLQKTKLQIEIEARNVIAIKNLLKTNPSLVTATYQNNYTALHLAAHEGQKAIVKTLISYGADIHARAKNGDTPLDIAKKRNHLAVVNILEGKGDHPGKKQDE